jgi:pimeloyl-ACP methyl ester carboxylesterase
MTAGNITRHFVRVGDREVHYRRVGSGPPFVLFHVSPQNSSFVLPQMMPLAADYTLIALDTPGYGESDGLGLPAPAMADYADAVAATFDALGIESAPVYGSHTGANVAVELARRSPGHVAGLILDGLSLSTPEVAQDRISRYAPPFTPTSDGAHLAWAWQHTRDQVLFWPWYEPHRANRLTGDVSSAEFIHDVVHAKMSAADYWLGYRAAFGHDSRDALRELGVDTYFVTAESDEHTEIERSIEGLPDSVHFVDTSREAQLDAIRRVLAAIDGQSSIDTATEPPHRTETYRSYVRICEVRHC